MGGLLMSETNATKYNFSERKQFLRYAEVVVKNFKKEEKLTISNDFEIEFEYFKTLDQTKEDDSGKITIYGLTPETIALLEAEGGEVWLRCGYVLSGWEELIIAYISKVYSENRNNTSVTTIECSANLLSHFYSGYAASGDEIAIPLSRLLVNFGTSLGYPYTSFNIDNIPKEHLEKISNFISSYKTNYYSVGDLRTVMEQVCEHFGLTSQRALLEDTKDTLVFSLTDLGIKRALSIIDRGYESLPTMTEEANNRYSFFLETQTSQLSEDNTIGFVLTKDTGLISSQNEYQLISAFQNEPLNANERETAESVYKRNNPEEPKKKRGGNAGEVEALLARTQGQNGTPAVGGDGANPFVSNNDLVGLRIKPDFVKGTKIREATGGGNPRLETVSLAFRVQQLLGSELIRFTGFNDHYHKVNSPRSLHTQGKSFDFTITSGHKGAPSVQKRVEALAASLGVRVNVDDEYNKPSSKATAPHIHVDVYGKGTGSTPSTIDNNNVNTDEDNTQQGDPYGRVPIEIIRRYNKVTALLNPNVKPQSIIYTEDKGTDFLIAHRVRHASYSGNNKRGDWTMVLYCEDTQTGIVNGGKVESTPEERELAPESLTQ